MPSTLKTMAVRPFAQLRTLVPWPAEKFVSVQMHSLSDERRVLWQAIEAPATIKALGRDLWSSLKDFNRYWPEFRSFIAQAKLYDDAAETLKVPRVHCSPTTRL